MMALFKRHPKGGHIVALNEDQMEHAEKHARVAFGKGFEDATEAEYQAQEGFTPESEKKKAAKTE